MSDDDDEDFDSIFAGKGNHASIYINAIIQAASVAVILLFNSPYFLMGIFRCCIREINKN
jgi:hypothetical protein